MLGSSVRADDVAVSTFVHADTNDTVVVNPRLRGRLQLGSATYLNLEYGVDVWTSASIDIMTSASPVPVTEQRDEIIAGVDHEFEDVSVLAGYRYSTENDYTSHSGSVGGAWNFADNNATLALLGFASFDAVGRADDPNFSEHLTSYGIRPSFTQVLGPNTLAQIIYEFGVQDGYQSSPYRYVGLGGGPGGNGRCNQNAATCVPEHNPAYRQRNAVALTGRHAFSDSLSSGLNYRFYLDDWGVLSNTFNVDLNWWAGHNTLLGVRYRGYVQTAADHYQARYFQPQVFVTSDKELGPLSSHRISFELKQTWEFAAMRKLDLLVTVAPVFYFYSDFIPLDRITAVQTNVALRADL